MKLSILEKNFFFFSLVKHISLSQSGLSIDVYNNQIISNQSQTCFLFDNISSELALASLDRNQRSMFVNDHVLQDIIDRAVARFVRLAFKNDTRS